MELIGWSLGLPDASTGRPFDHLPFWTKVATEAIASAEAKMLVKE
jgi:triacylglycerol lipase